MSISSWESYLTPQEQQFFNQCFRAASRSQTGLVTGPEAVRFFATSGVPNQILSDIWETADRDNQGYLTPETFSIALKLIACTQHGKEPQNPVLSTSVPLPQFEGLDSEVASPRVGATAAATGPAMTITPEEREKYYSIFRVHQPAGGTLDGTSAKNIFMKSKLPTEALGQIWNLADVRQTGNLNQAEFAIAMHYIAKLMDGTISTLPSQLPPSVYATAAGDNPPVQPIQQQQQLPPQRSQTIDSLGSLAFSSSTGVDQPSNQQQQWKITPQEKIQFDAFFDKIDTKRTGFVQGTDAVEFFTNSRLPEADLAQIWDLADSSQQGRLSRDQFAVAMHLIHKRLRGEPLPNTLPNALSFPQGTSPAMAPAVAAQSPAMMHHQPAVQSPLATNTSPFENQDLLGDFGDNEQLTQVTNQVNQLQNQMAALKTSTGQVQHQKMDAQQTLEQLSKQKKELQAQLAQVQLAHETEVKELQELQQQVENERPGWIQAQQEHDAAQQQLIATQNEIAQLQQTLESSRAESEQLRKRVHEIQDETAQLTTQLNNLRSQLKQQDMMLDINRRQVTASEQDRDQAKRDLEDFKEERQLSDDVVEAAKPKKKEESPQVAAASSPATAPSTNIFDMFAAKPTDKDDTGKKEGSPNDFDAIFGNIQSSKPASPATQSSPFSPFDPVGWATPPEPAAISPPSTTTRAARPAPPPPPPQSRHHRNTSDASHTTASTTTSVTKKPRAPPPPPPTAQKSSDKPDNDFGSAFLPSTSTDNKTTSPPVDDFDAAFSGQMSNAQVVQQAGNDFDGFDDAFASFDKEAKPSDTKKTNTSDLNWASNFGGFDFAESDTKGNGNKEDDWDSIFGGSSTKNTAAATSTTATENKDDNNEKNVFGFEDAFSNSGFAAAAAAAPTPTKQELSLSGDNSNLDELMKMGFERKQAKEALDRYDQDLVKASNFLLDQSSK